MTQDDASTCRETEALRARLARLAREAKADRLPERFPLRYRPKEKLGLYRRLRIAVGRVLRRLGLRRTPFFREPWTPRLKHLRCDENARVLVIWALGADRDTLRAACRAFQQAHAAAPRFVPVLVTDVADFAFFSRLGWLVEYVPQLSAPAHGYAARKERYLAWRYRDAAAVPVTVGLRDPSELARFLAPLTSEAPPGDAHVAAVNRPTG